MTLPSDSKARDVGAGTGRTHRDTQPALEKWREQVLDLIDECPGLSREQDRWLSRKVRELGMPESPMQTVSVDAAAVRAACGKIIKTLAEIVNAPQTDAQFDAQLVPCDPLMRQVQDIREQVDAIYKALPLNQAAPQQAAPAEREATQGAIALSDEAICALQYAKDALAAIANREEIVVDVIRPLNSITAASKRAKAALQRLQKVDHYFEAANLLVAAPQQAAPAVPTRQQIVCDILANGSLLVPEGQRYTAQNGPGTDAEDADRWRETLMHVGAANHLGGQHFTLNTLRISDQVLLLRGSVAQHFTKCIDESRAARKAGE